jgi:hypothetical protein
MAACASARPLAAEGTGGPVVMQPLEIAVLVIGDAGGDLERDLRAHLERSNRIRVRSPEETHASWQAADPARAPTNEEACAAGRALHVDTVVVASVDRSADENTECVRNEVFTKNADCTQWRKTGQFSAAVTATLRTVSTATCEEEHTFHIGGSNASSDLDRGNSPSEQAAATAAYEAFGRDLDRALPVMFPIGARVTSSSGTRAWIDRGAADGITHGQVFGIMRGGEKRGHAVVDDIDRDRATVEAFTDDAVLVDGDVLAESGTTCCIEAIPLATALRTDVNGTGHIGAGAGLQVALYRPLSSWMVSSTLALLNAGANISTVMWTVDIGWLWRVIPRRLSLYAVAGGGPADARTRGARAGGGLVDAVLGLKLRLTDNFWVSGEGAWIAATRMDDWGGMLTEAVSVDLEAPLVRVGVGLRIP